MSNCKTINAMIRNIRKHIGFNWPTFTVLLVLTAIVGSISPVNSVRAGNAFRSIWVCASQGNVLCVLFLVLTALLIGGFLYALLFRKKGGGHGN